MATYYVDPAAAGAANGTSWTDAWTSLQTAADTAVAGDTVYCRGTQTLAASIDFDTNSGTELAGHIVFIGCNAAGADDGTRFVLDGNSAATYCLALGATISYVRIKNFECKNATSHGINGGGTSCQDWLIDNCYIHNNGGRGINGYLIAKVQRCRIENNSSNGIYRLYMTDLSPCDIRFCQIIGNGGAGITQYHTTTIHGCVIHDNTADEIELQRSPTEITNCVIDGAGSTADGIDCASATAVIVVGCRITNCVTYGIRAPSGRSGWQDYNYFDNNGTDVTGGIQGGDHNQADVDGAPEYGYVDYSEDDFNLASGATMRSVAIAMD